MADLARTLAELGAHIDLPEGGDPAAAALARIRAERDRRPLVPENDTNGRRTWVLVAAAVVVAVVAVAALPGPRGAVARLLGVGGVTITRGEVARELPAELDLGDPLAVDDALARLAGATLPDAGPPAQAFTGRPPRGVSLVWAATDDLPALAGSDAGLVLTVFPSSPESPLVGKVAGPGTGVLAVSVDGHPGYWVDGPHEVVFETPDGAATSARLAGNTLVWSDGQRTYRLESALDRSGALGLVSDDS